MSKWGWAARIGGFAAAPFTAGYSIPAGLAAGSAIEHKQHANDGPNGGGNDDEGNPEDPFTAQLSQSANSLRGTGAALRGQGNEAIAPALEYFKSLLSNNPSALMDATRPERGRVIDQYDTARKAIAEFGPRGGGTTSALAESQFDKAESLADITSTARRNASTGLASMGVQLQSLGLTAEQVANSSIEDVIQAVLAREGFDVARRGQNMQLAGDIGETIGTLIGIYMGKDAGGGAGAGAGG